MTTVLAIKRNPKKIIERKEPPPFNFSLPGTNYGRKGKESQDAQPQKTKPLLKPIVRTGCRSIAVNIAENEPRNLNNERVLDMLPSHRDTTERENKVLEPLMMRRVQITLNFRRLIEDRAWTSKRIKFF